MGKEHNIIKRMSYDARIDAAAQVEYQAQLKFRAEIRGKLILEPARLALEIIQKELFWAGLRTRPIRFNTDEWSGNGIFFFRHGGIESQRYEMKALRWTKPGIYFIAYLDEYNVPHLTAYVYQRHGNSISQGPTYKIGSVLEKTPEQIVPLLHEAIRYCLYS